MKLKRIPILEFHFGEAFFTSTVGEIESSIKHLMENVAQAQLEADKRALLKEATEKEQMWQGYTEMAVKQERERIVSIIEANLAPEDKWFIAGRKFLQALKEEK